MFGLIKKMFINLHRNEYTQELRYYPFTVNLDRCVGICNAVNDLSTKVFVPNKTEDLNLSMFNMNTGLNESKTLTKHMSYECSCEFDRACNASQKWNNDKCWCECEKHVKKITFGILLHEVAKMVNIQQVLLMIQ